MSTGSATTTDHSPTAGNAAGGVSTALSLSNLPGHLQDLIRSTETIDELARGFVSLMAELTGAEHVGLWTLSQRGGSLERLAATERSAAGGPAPPEWNASLQELACQSATSSSLEIRPLDPAGSRVAVAVPVLVDGEPSDACTAVFAVAAGQSLEPLVLLLELAVGHVGLWRTQEACRERGWESFAAAVVLELVQQLAVAPSPEMAARMLAELVGRQLTCPLVAVGCVNDCGRIGQVFVSGQAEPARHSRPFRAIESLLAESRSQDRTHDEPHTATGPVAGELCTQLGSPEAWLQTLRGPQGQPIAELIVFRSPLGDRDRQRLLLRSASAALGECLTGVESRHRRGWTFHLAWPVVRTRRRLALAGLGLGLAMAVAVWPVPAKISGPCRVAPLSRRFVAAPFDATLEQMLVKTGQLVTAGQCLAVLDGRPLRLERAAVEAELAQASKQRDVYLAAHQTAEAALARLEVEKLSLRLAALDHHLQHLEIECPASGVVLTGDVEDAQGAPLALGQTLLEIAPLDRVRVEIGVPDDQISLVHRGGPAKVRLEALAGQALAATVEEIHPAAELWDGQNVFVAEIELANPAQTLRPGMAGTAQIAGPRAARLAHWLRRPWQRLQAIWAAYE